VLYHSYLQLTKLTTAKQVSSNNQRSHTNSRWHQKPPYQQCLHVSKAAAVVEEVLLQLRQD
jgi:hypothetical protein